MKNCFARQGETDDGGEAPSVPRATANGRPHCCMHDYSRMHDPRFYRCSSPPRFSPARFRCRRTAPHWVSLRISHAPHARSYKSSSRTIRCSLDFLLETRNRPIVIMLGSCSLNATSAVRSRPSVKHSRCPSLRRGVVGRVSRC